MEHIYPIFDKILNRETKETRLKQRSCVVWLVGLSGSGKSTIASALEKKLFETGFITQLLDGDNLRNGLNANLSFSTFDRNENLRRTSEVAKLFKEAGIITICSFISPTVEIRNHISEIVSAEDYQEIYVNCPLEVCEQRDVKGLYKLARDGKILDFTGISSPFEEPTTPSLTLFSGKDSLDECVKKLFDHLLPIISYQNK